jgi:two-component system sensor histidine kinase DegS
VVPNAKAPSKPKQPPKPVVKAAPAEVPPPAPVDDAADSLKRRLTRLALDVHDGPMQNLAVIGFSLGDLKRRISAVVPEEHHTKIDDGMEQISSELVRVEAELRALISALEHNGHEYIPVVDAIQQEIDSFEKRCAAEVVFKHEGDIRTETDSQRIALQSVTRAALANVAKHAAAKTVKIRLSGDGDSVTLEIQDDGRGFNADAPPKKNRFGLVGMRERVELLGGEFRVKSRPGGPTKIKVRLQIWSPPASA